MVSNLNALIIISENHKERRAYRAFNYCDGCCDAKDHTIFQPSLVSIIMLWTKRTKGWGILQA